MSGGRSISAETAPPFDPGPGLRIFGLAVALAAVFPGAAGADPNGTPSFTNARYGEDWSYLKDGSQRTGAWWEPLKFIPIDSENWIYLTLGADLRLRYEGYAQNLEGSPNPDDRYGWSRVLPYADLHLGPDLRLFGRWSGLGPTGAGSRRGRSMRPGSTCSKASPNGVCRSTGAAL